MMAAEPGSSTGESADGLRLSVAADSSLLATVRMFVASAARQSGISDEATADLKLAASEVAAAIIETGHAGRIELDAQLEHGALSLSVRSDAAIADMAAADGSIRHRLLEALFPDAQVGEDGSWSVTLDTGADANGSAAPAGNDGASV